MTKNKKRKDFLFEGAEWDFEKLKRTYDAISEIALNDLGLDVYPNQLEVVSAEQMLDAYASVGMPLMFKYWAYGKHFAQQEEMYRRGRMGLAYEMVINSNPCISYNMEENTMALQTLVMAHAAFGHNHFFKNNQLFKEWTDAEFILDYLSYAKDFVARCEEKYGADAVEELLDAAHALQRYGVFRYSRHQELSKKEVKKRNEDRLRDKEQSYDEIFERTAPNIFVEEDDENVSLSKEQQKKRKKKLGLPEENLLYFLEKNSPVLIGWQREILSIMRHLAQYFYPQKQTKMMNEGCACFVHYYIINALYDKGLLSDGTMLEILKHHSNVVLQFDYDDRRYSGLNPYALGFHMMMDIKRICEDPTDEDREWFPTFAGSDDWRSVLKDAWSNYRDESFIRQFLSPHLIRHFKFFELYDDSEDDEYEVTDIHDEKGYRRIRNTLARMYDISHADPNIQIVDVDLTGDRELCLEHKMRDDMILDVKTAAEVNKHLSILWGYDVYLTSVDEDGTEEVIYD